MIVSRLILPTILMILIASVAPNAQVSAPSRGCGCFKGYPGPQCCGFFILEGGLKFRTGDKNYRDKAKTYLLSYEFGYLVNHGTRWAYGGAIYWSGDDDGSRWAVRARLRKWVTSKAALDYSLGPIVGGSDNRVDLKMPGFAASISYGRANWISMSATFEAIRIGALPNFQEGVTAADETEWRTAFFFGGTISHWPAIITPIIFIVLIGLSLDA